MTSLQTILGQPASPEAFHASATARLASQADGLRQKARLIGQQFPALKADTVRKADLALQGMLVLPGTSAQPYFVGSPPGWKLNPVQDNEYVWSLNRMMHWIPLLQAYSLTGQGNYARRVTDELRDWLASCPRPPVEAIDRFNGVDPWRMLEAGIRMFSSWPLVLAHLLGSEHFNPELLAAFAASVFEHGEALYRVSPVLYPQADHNHYLMESLGLLTAACLFPEFSTVEKWKAHAVRELERCAAVQIAEEGGQIEGCPHYHNACIGFFVRALSVARANGINFSPDFLLKIKRGIDYSMYSLRPSGTAVPWGDSDADIALPVDAALSGYRLFQQPDYLQIAVNCCGAEAVRARCVESAWEDSGFREVMSAIDRIAAQPNKISLPCDSWQKSLHQVMLRTA